MAELKFTIIREKDEDGIPAGEYTFLYVPTLPRGSGVLGVQDVKLTSGETNRPTFSRLVQVVAGVPADAIKLHSFYGADTFVVTAVPDSAPPGVKACCVAFYIPGVEDVWVHGNPYEFSIVMCPNPMNLIKNLEKMGFQADMIHSELAGFEDLRLYTFALRKP